VNGNDSLALVVCSGCGSLSTAAALLEPAHPSDRRGFYQPNDGRVGRHSGSRPTVYPRGSEREGQDGEVIREDGQGKLLAFKTEAARGIIEEI
jgi:hypothetical protein